MDLKCSIDLTLYGTNDGRDDAAGVWRLQPDTYTLVLEYSNLFFSGLFAVEMLMKVLAEGLFGYVRNGFNVFDGFIVVLR